MSPALTLLSTFLYVALVHHLTSAEDCCIASVDFDIIDRSLNDEFCDQPLFLTLATWSEGIDLIDNVCHTFFPLPDDPDTYTLYSSTVYCDGSSSVVTQIASQYDEGILKKAIPFCSWTDFFFGYAGCETYLIYRCMGYGGCYKTGDILGLSSACQPIGLSCLLKVQQVISNAGLLKPDLYVFPMKLPNKCVTQQLCLTPPNPFYNKIPYYSTTH